MSKWPMVPLGEVLTRRKEEVDVIDFETYKRLTIRLNGNGIAVRDQLLGSDIGTKKQFRVHSGQLVLSKIDARNGAFGVLSSDGDDAIITGNFWAFDHQPDRLEIRFMEYFTKTAVFVNLCVAASEGTTNRLYLQEDLFLQMQIPLPALSEQKHIVEWIDDMATRLDDVNSEAESAVKRLDKMLMSAFHEITADVPRRPMNDVAPIVRRQVKVHPANDYPELGVRCFGKGTFQKPPLSGLDVGTKKLYAIEPGDLVFSNVFAWEGAIAVAKDEDKGRYGSHRFITCVPNSGVATAVFLNFYFQTPEGIEQIRDASPGGAGRNRTLGLNKLEQITVPVPRYELQLWFDQLHEKIETAKKTITQAGKVRDAILPSLLNQVFNGEELA
jgi:type I restriction enzyme S subunit